MFALVEEKNRKGIFEGTWDMSRYIAGNLMSGHERDEKRNCAESPEGYSAYFSARASTQNTAVRDAL